MIWLTSSLKKSKNKWMNGFCWDFYVQRSVCHFMLRLLSKKPCFIMSSFLFTLGHAFKNGISKMMASWIHLVWWRDEKFKFESYSGYFCLRHGKFCWIFFLWPKFEKTMQVTSCCTQRNWFVFFPYHLSKSINHWLNVDLRVSHSFIDVIS